MATIPSLTRTIDDAFTHTWLDIKPEATDQILESNVISAALKEKGCFKTQVGGDRITEPVRYGVGTATHIAKGDTLSHGEVQTETMAWWNWKYTSSHASRSLIDDQQNSGPLAIKKLVTTRLKAAKEAMEDDLESALTEAVDTAGGTDLRADRDPDSLYNILPGGSYYNQAAGTYVYGNIDTGTGNTWWQGQYKSASGAAELVLLDDMRNLYNTCMRGRRRMAPNLIITEQNMFEVYEAYAQERSQILSNMGSRLADLGYEVLKFKGKDMVWSNAITDGTMFFLNTNFIKVVYDPNLWYQMTEWKDVGLQNERVAHINSAWNMICSQLRCQGFLGTYS